MSVKCELKFLFGVCGVMYIEDTCGELWPRLLSDDAVCILNCNHSVQYTDCIITKQTAP